MNLNRYIAFDVETPNRFNNRMSAIGISVIENDQIVKDAVFLFIIVMQSEMEN